MDVGSFSAGTKNEKRTRQCDAGMYKIDVQDVQQCVPWLLQHLLTLDYFFLTPTVACTINTTITPD